MLTNNEIIKKLHELEVTDESIEHVMQDVMRVIIDRVLSQCLINVASDEHIRLKKLSVEQMIDYINTHQNNINHLDQIAFETLHDEVWSNYFNAMSK